MTKERSRPLPDRLLKEPEVREIFGMSRMGIYRAVKEGRLPPPVEVGKNTIAWWESELMACLKSLPRRTYRPPLEAESGEAA